MGAGAFKNHRTGFQLIDQQPVRCGHGPAGRARTKLAVGLEIRFAAQRGGRKIGCQDRGAAGWAMIDTVTQRQGKKPEPRRLDLPLLPTGQGERYYLERFMAEFGKVLLFSRNEASAK